MRILLDEQQRRLILNIVSIGSLCVALAAFLLSIYNNGKKESKEESEELAKIMTRLVSLSEDVREIKEDFRREISDLKASHQQDHDRIIKLEMKMESANKKIDELRGKV